MFIIQTWNQLLSFFAGNYHKNMLFRNFSVRYLGNIYYAEKVYTSSNEVISPFAAKYRKIIANDQINFYHLLQQNGIKFVLKKAVTQKPFLHMYYFQNVLYLETINTSATELLSLFASKHPKKLLLWVVSFSLTEWQSF